jgi:hypothetical protein
MIAAPSGASTTSCTKASIVTAATASKNRAQNRNVFGRFEPE